MGTPYLLDTNTIIYFLDSHLPEKSLDFIESALDDTGSFLSVISKMELLGWQAPAGKPLHQIERFIEDSFVFPLTDSIVDKTIELRKTQKIKLPDAIIAATALVHAYTLMSRNDDDFRKIPGLKYCNPFTDI